jgi:cell division initiation protein
VTHHLPSNPHNTDKLSPLDIRHQEFPSRFRGYDRASVRAFLAQISDELETLLQGGLQQRERLTVLERELEEQKQVQDEIRRAVMAAERIGHEMRENATRESELLLAQAGAQSDQLLREAQSRNVEMEAQHGARMAALEATFHSRFADLERDHHQLLLERERVQTERINALERAFAQRHAELTSRLAGARQEYVQFLGGYRALMSSFSELSARHVLPEDMALPSSSLPAQNLSLPSSPGDERGGADGVGLAVPEATPGPKEDQLVSVEGQQFL